MERICFKYIENSESTSPSCQKQNRNFFPEPLQHQHFSGEEKRFFNATRVGKQKPRGRTTSKMSDPQTSPKKPAMRRGRVELLTLSSSYFLGNKSNDGPVSQPQSNLATEKMGGSTWGLGCFKEREKFPKFWATYLFGEGQVGESMARSVDEASLKKKTLKSWAIVSWNMKHFESLIVFPMRNMSV